MKKRFFLSVTDFAVPTPLEGSIDTYSGYAQGSLQGMHLHNEIQEQRKKEFPSYSSEVQIQHEFKFKRFRFVIRGRIDGTYEKEKFHIEEIKTAFNLNKLKNYIHEDINSHPYCLQLKTYGYIHWLKTKEIPALNLYLVSTRNKKSISLQIDLNIDQYEEWLTFRLLSLVAQIKQTEKHIKRRKETSESFRFPFPSPRGGQRELIETLDADLKKNHPVLIQAPTGLGKTIGILYPTLKEAMSRGQKIIYVTPKNSQHNIALDAVKSLQNAHTNTALVITAKSKVCFKEQPICNREYCEFAKDYYTKVSDHKILMKLKRFKNVTETIVRRIGRKYQVCPFQLQLDHIANVDTIICDYNYVFSPQANQTRVAKLFLGETEPPNLLIDEFHNLPERGREYYSSQLSVFNIKEYLLSISRVDPYFRDHFSLLLSQACELIRSCGLENHSSPYKIASPIMMFKKMEFKLKELLAGYVESDIEILQGDLILSFCNSWIDFTSVLEFIDSASNEFFVSYHPQEFAIKVTCCDASSFLKQSYAPFKKVVGFSATLKPFHFYSQLTGLSESNLKTHEFSSPFPKSRRKLLLIPQISSKYSDRNKNYPRIVYAIRKITNERRGNYIIFFPSYQFLENVYQLMPPISDFKYLSQKRNMKVQEVNTILEQLKDYATSHIVFAVQGGNLSEGIDYPGNMIIGAIIVGVPLPLFAWERQQLKKYYEDKYQAGFDYAYVYLAMAKTIQAAGRVLRSEQDKGIIVLMDDRFLHVNYSSCMPKDWFEQSPSELISHAILSDIRDFWDNCNA